MAGGGLVGAPPDYREVARRPLQGIAMAPLDFDGAIAADSLRFVDVLADIDPATPVPSCPDWDAADLLWHLAEVQVFWAEIVARRLSNPGPAEAAKPARPGRQEALVDIARRATTSLLEALSDADDDTTVWTWASDRSVAFVRRRQAHEALVHRVDAELAGSLHSPVDAALASDGADEVLRVMFGTVPDWATFRPGDHTVRIVTTDTDDAWRVRPGQVTGTNPRSGTRDEYPGLVVGRGGNASPDATVAGPAAMVDLWLWSRMPADGLTTTGDPAAFDALAHVVADGIQ